jgi:hypothetical protein
MKLLPKRYIRFALRVATRFLVFGDLTPSSKSAAGWLYAWPRLLGWERRVNWLFLRVCASKSRYNLWGIDSAGQVIIVEVRTNGTDALRDPFRSLASQLKGRCNESSWSSRELRANWRESLGSQHPVADESPAAYRRAVEMAFAKRQAAGNPSPILVVVVGSRRSEFCLSEKGIKNLLWLENLAGSSRVVLRAINGRFGLSGIGIKCWSPRLSRTVKRKSRRLR